MLANFYVFQHRSIHDQGSNSAAQKLAHFLRHLLPLIATAMLLTPTVFAQNDTGRPLITVTGQAEVLVVPDEAVFTMSAYTFDKDLSQAQVRNDEIVRNVIAIARKYQVPANLVQTGHISLDERYSDPEVTKRPRVLLGYEVTKQIAIILRDVSKAEALLTEIFKSGITIIKGVEFRTTQIRKYKDQARAMAMKAAREKAIAMAREIDQNIGKAYSISEEGLFNPSAAMNSNNFSLVTRSGGSDSAEDSAIALGQISISARVTVSFELK